MNENEKFIEKILNNRIILAVLLLALCGPYMLTRDLEQTKVIYGCATMLASWFMIILYARYGKWSFGVKWLAAFMLWTFLTTYFISGNVLSFYQVFLPIIGASLLAELAIEYKAVCVLDMTAIYRLYIYANLVLILLKPFGYKPQARARWLLGYRNIQAWFLLPLATILILRALWKFRKLDLWTCIDLALITVTIVIIKSSTSWVGGFVYLFMALIGLFFYKKKKKLPGIFNLFDGIVLSVAFYVGIIVCKLQSVFSALIVNVLQRDITFSSRVSMWDMTRDYLKSRWFAGCGYMTVQNFKKIFGKYAHPHNYILSVMMQGGIILLLIVCAGLVVAAVRLYKNRASIIANLFMGLLLSFLVMGMTEALSAYLCPLLYPVLLLAMRTKELDEVIKVPEGTEKIG